MVTGGKKRKSSNHPSQPKANSLFRIKEHIFRRLDKKKNYIMGKTSDYGIATHSSIFA